MSIDTELCVKFNSLILTILTIKKYQKKEIIIELKKKMNKPINDPVYAKQAAKEKKKKKK